MKKEYVTFVASPKGLPEGEEIRLTIRDLTPGRQKYDARNVKAIVSSSAEQLPEGDILWLRSPVGVLSPQPWAIKITAELEEFLPGPPYAGILPI